MEDTCECGNEPSGSINVGNFLTSCKLVSFSRTLLHGVSMRSVFVLIYKGLSMYTHCVQ